MGVRPNNYGLFISLAIHAVIFAIPVSMVVSRHFKEVELFVIDERVVHPVKEKIVKPKPKEMPKEVIKEVQPQPVVSEPDVKEESTAEVIEPVVVSNRPVVAPMPPVPRPEPPAVAAQPRPLSDVEFGSQNAPQFLHREMPKYPLIARRLGKEGKVVMRLTIDEDGNLLNVEVIEGSGYGFTEAAVEAVKKSTFLPAKIDGRPVMAKALLTIRFNLRRD